MIILLLVFLTAVAAGLGFWFYNRRQINYLTDTLEDKNAIIDSFRDYLTVPTEKVENLPDVSFTSEKIVVDMRPEKKKKHYNNRPKKSVTLPDVKTKQGSKENSEKKNRPKPRKPKTQQ